MPPRRTSLQVDVSRDLYIVCAFMYQGMPHQQAQAFTVAHNPLFGLEASLMSTIVAIPTVLPGNPE